MVGMIGSVVTVALWVGGSGGVLPPSSVHAAQRSVPGDEAAGFEELMARAEKQRAAGQHGAAAWSYAVAYRALPESEQVGLVGEIAIDNALVAYRQAFEQGPAALALLEDPIALLEEFIAVRARAHGEGEAEAVPEQLREELARLRAQLDEARPEPNAMPDPGPTDVEPDEPDESDEPVGVASSGLPPNGVGQEPEQDRPATRKADAAILAGGIVALVGGAALVGGGAWNFSMTDRQGQARLQALEEGEFTEPAREEFRAELSAWQDRWRGTATGLVVAGSVLAAAGIGLTTWGGVRMRRNGRASKRRASVGLPVVSRGRVGVVVLVRF